MKYLKSLLLLGLALNLAACVEFDGNFEAEQEITFMHSTMFGNQRARVVPAGNYATEMSFQTFSDKIKLELEGRESFSIKIDVPSNIRIPDNGEFYLPATRTNQKHDLEGNVMTDVDRSDVYHRTETCFYTVYRRVCDTVCTPRPDGGSVCRPVCRTQPVSKRGYRNVSFYYEDIQKLLEMKVVDSRSSEVLGTYTGSDSSSKKVYTRQGQCNGPYYYGL